MYIYSKIDTKLLHARSRAGSHPVMIHVAEANFICIHTYYYYYYYYNITVNRLRCCIEL